MICCHGFLKYQILHMPVDSGHLMVMTHIINARTRNNAPHSLSCLYTYAGLCMKDAWGRLYHCDKLSLVTTAFSLAPPTPSSLFRHTEAWIINEYITSIHLSHNNSVYQGNVQGTAEVVAYSERNWSNVYHVKKFTHSISPLRVFNI